MTLDELRDQMRFIFNHRVIFANLFTRQQIEGAIRLKMCRDMVTCGALSAAETNAFLTAQETKQAFITELAAKADHGVLEFVTLPHSPLPPSLHSLS